MAVSTSRGWVGVPVQLHTKFLELVMLSWAPGCQGQIASKRPPCSQRTLESQGAVQTGTGSRSKPPALCGAPPPPLAPPRAWVLCSSTLAHSFQAVTGPCVQNPRPGQHSQSIPHAAASPAPGWPPDPSWAPHAWLSLWWAGRPRRLPVLALFFLVPLQEGAGKLAQAEATLGGQLAHGFLHSQVAAAEALTDLTTTVRARGLLLLQPGIC